MPPVRLSPRSPFRTLIEAWDAGNSIVGSRSLTKSKPRERGVVGATKGRASMRNFSLVALLASVTGLTACATVPAEPVTASNTACGTYGYVDVDNDGFITRRRALEHLIARTLMASGTLTRTAGSTAPSSRIAGVAAVSIATPITTPTIGRTTGPPSTPTATVTCPMTNIGQPRRGHG